MIKQFIYLLTLLAVIPLQSMNQKRPAKDKLITESPALKRSTGQALALASNLQLPVPSSTENTIKLISADKKEFIIKLSTAQLSQAISSMISKMNAHEPLLLPDITSKQLAIIVESLNTIASITNTENYAHQVTKALNSLFINMPFSDVIKTLKIANQLRIPSLLNYCTIFIASKLIKDTNLDRVAYFIDQLNNHSHDISSLILETLKQTTNNLVLPLFLVQLKEFTDTHTAICSIAFSHDSKLALAGFSDGTAILWNVNTGDAIRIFKGHTHVVTSVAFSSDNKRILTGSDDNTAIIWEVENGSIVQVLGGHLKGITAVAFSPDNKFALTGSTDKTAILWDVNTGKIIHTLIGHTNDITSLIFSPNGTFAATCSFDATVRIWDIVTGKSIHVLKGHTDEIWSIAFNFDGSLILIGSNDNSASIWSVNTGNIIHVLKGHKDNVTSVAFSPDGRLALTGSRDGIAILWDVNTGKIIHRLEGHTHVVTSVAFSPNGTLALTGSCDNTARVWDVVLGRAIYEFKGHTNWVQSVMFTPNGNLILTHSWDGTAILWGMHPEYNPSIPLLILLHKLNNPDTKDTILEHSYFRAVLEAQSPAIQKIIKEHFALP